MTKTYILEVVRFITEKDGPDGWYAKGGKEEHVGYMNARFRTKKDACSYYDRHNPHMRALNSGNTYISDWDPITHLRYIVREDYHILATIVPFGGEIDSGITTRDGKSIHTEAKYQK